MRLLYFHSTNICYADADQRNTNIKCLSFAEVSSMQIFRGEFYWSRCSQLISVEKEDIPKCLTQSFAFIAFEIVACIKHRIFLITFRITNFSIDLINHVFFLNKKCNDSLIKVIFFIKSFFSCICVQLHQKWKIIIGIYFLLNKTILFSKIWIFNVYINIEYEKIVKSNNLLRNVS